MICRELAQRLGPHLNWTPRNADRFFIPREEIADQTFVVSDMVIEHRPDQVEQNQGNFHFNGTTEWALDSIESAAAVWLPAEQQLRDELGTAFLSLDRTGDDYVVTVNGPQGAHHTAAVDDAADAYALALLHLVGADDAPPADRQPAGSSV